MRDTKGGAVGKRKKLFVIVAAIACVIVIVGGASSVAAGLGEDDTGAAIPSTGSVSTTAPGTAEDIGSSHATATTSEPFGQMISALRHAGDHTPAAVLMGKKVPGQSKK